MSDVTALVLSMGEDYTERAIASVRRQTLPAVEAIVVQGISPFHRAFNSGAARVRTPFFVQVDADMILDETCIADLRSCVSDGVGMVVGHLRDPLLGRLQGIKLFRTQCCNQAKLRDSASCETDFIEDIQRQGWTTTYALKDREEPSFGWHVFGEHRPDYTLSYTFCKYVREGVKARYRKAGGGLRSVFRRLSASDHPAARIAAIAAAHGIFVEAEWDIHAPDAYSEEFARLEQFLMTLVLHRTEGDGCHSEPEQRGGEESRRTADCPRDSSACGLRMTDPQNQCDGTLAAAEDTSTVADDLGPGHPGKGFRRIYDFIRLRLVGVQRFLLASRFKRAYALGIRLRRQQAPSAFITCMKQLQQTNDLASWVALVGLCHGLFADEYREAEAEEAFIVLKELLPR
ncbi:MAG: glycosyltransferase family 2 protein [Candidatus Binatia bacterium]